MARIAGVNIPSGKRIEIALTYIFGIGPTRARQICTEINLDERKRVNSLTEEELGKIRDVIEKKFTVEGDLRREVSVNIKRLMDLGTNRGIRHRRKLPTRGQNTKNNARTRKGPKKPMRG